MTVDRLKTHRVAWYDKIHTKNTSTCHDSPEILSCGAIHSWVLEYSLCIEPIVDHVLFFFPSSAFIDEVHHLRSISRSFEWPANSATPWGVGPGGPNRVPDCQLHSAARVDKTLNVEWQQVSDSVKFCELDWICEVQESMIDDVQHASRDSEVMVPSAECNLVRSW